jgi:hypothetical protein
MDGERSASHDPRPAANEQTGGRPKIVTMPLSGDNMIRTQVSLNKSEYDLAKAQAAAQGISVAEFVRRAVREALPVPGEGAWMKYAGMVATGDPHSSQSIDEIVYGSKD